MAVTGPRARLPATRVVLMTSDEPPGDFDRFRSLGVHAQIAKPIMPTSWFAPSRPKHPVAR